MVMTGALGSVSDIEASLIDACGCAASVATAAAVVVLCGAGPKRVLARRRARLVI